MKIPLENRWKVRVGSPGELSWELYQSLVSKGYTAEKIQENVHEAVKLVETPIEGVANFTDRIEVYKELPIRTIWWMLIMGVILLFTIILFPIGLWLIRRSIYKFIHVITMNIEGETYRAGARTQDPHRAQSEVLDIVSDARIILKGNITLRRLSGVTNTTKNQTEWKRLKADFQELCGELDRLIHKITLPETT